MWCYYRGTNVESCNGYYYPNEKCRYASDCGIVFPDEDEKKEDKEK